MSTTRFTEALENDHPIVRFDSSDRAAGIWTAGLFQRLVDDIPSGAADLVERMARQANHVIDSRLAAMPAEPAAAGY